MLQARAFRGAATGRVGAAWSPPGAVALPLACGACLLTGAAYVAAVDPDEGGLGACPVRAATGRWCPGCGLTRATHHLLRGDVVPALSLNVLAPLVLAGLAIAWWTWLRVAAGRGVARWVAAIRVRTYVAAGAIVALFVVVRNLPGWEWLRGGL